MKNILEKYMRTVIGKNIDMDGVYGSQCVDLVKHYSLNVVKIGLGTFGGSAKTGRENTSNTFPKEDWIKIKNNYSDPEQIPEKGDIIFFGYGQYGHVGIVYKVYPGENRVTILNQNTGNGDGYGTDDRTKIEDFTYDDVLGWYRCKRFMVEYKGLPVFHVKQPTNKPNTNASYSKYKKIILLYPRFYTKTIERQNAILEHEYSHHIYYNLPSKTKALWAKISGFEAIKEQLELFYGDKYKTNAYLNTNARKNIKEDFSESWEYFVEHGESNFGDYRDFKIKIVVKLMNKYTGT